EEYGVRISTFDGKLDLKVARYTTVADKASVGNLSGAIGQLASLINNVVDRNFAGDNIGNPAGIAAFEAWIDSPTGKVFQNAFSQSFVPNSDSAKPPAQYGRYEDSGSDRGQITAVSALESTGVEIEMVYNP